MLVLFCFTLITELIFTWDSHAKPQTNVVSSTIFIKDFRPEKVILFSYEHEKRCINTVFHRLGRIFRVGGRSRCNHLLCKADLRSSDHLKVSNNKNQQLKLANTKKTQAHNIKISENNKKKIQFSSQEDSSSAVLKSLLVQLYSELIQVMWQKMTDCQLQQH